MSRRIAFGPLAYNSKTICQHGGDCYNKTEVSIWWENHSGEMISNSIDLCKTHADLAIASEVSNEG